MPDNSQQFDQLSEKIEEVLRTLRGTNGTPGLVERVHIVETRQCNIDDLVEVIRGDVRTPGLLERIRSFERSFAEFQKWSYLIISTCIVIIVGAAISALPKIVALLNTAK